MMIRIDPPLTKLMKTIIGIALLLWIGLVFSECDLHAQNSKWFTLTLGETTCTGTTVAQTPIKVSFTCSNPYGGYAGSYTAVGNAAPNVFLISLNSLAPALPSAVTCSIGINATPLAVVAGSLGTIPPNSGAYSCSGLGQGTTVFTVPVAKRSRGFKGRVAALLGLRK